MHRGPTVRAHVLVRLLSGICLVVAVGLIPESIVQAAQSGMSSGQPIVAYPELTLALWVRTDEFRSGLLFRQQDSRGRGMKVELVAGRPQVTLVGSTGSAVLSPAEKCLVEPGSWHLLAITVDPSRDGAMLRLDGRPIANTMMNVGIVASPLWQTSPAAQKPTTPGVDVREYVNVGRALPATEMALLQMAGPPPKQPSTAVMSDTVSNRRREAPLELRLWPQPVRGQLHIDYVLRRSKPVSVEVFDAQGRRQLYQEFGWRSRGAGTLIVDATRLSARGGAWHIVRIKAGDEEMARPFILLR